MADDFEIKLEAYIDGMLAPHERMELERQLMSSPKHRRIVDQLLRTRQLIATLPRVQAPPEILESIDPSVERAALFDEQDTRRRRMLISPQVLALAAAIALAATLVVSMLLLIPADEPLAVNPQTAPQQTTGGSDLVAANDQQTPEPREQPGEGVQPEPAEMADGGNDAPVRPEPEALADGARTDVVEPEAFRLPTSAADAVLISAAVDDVARASGTVFQFLAAADVAIESQRLPTSALPEPVRERLGLPQDTMVQIFTVSELSLQQVGTLTTELAGGGSASALAPANLVSEYRPAIPQTQQAEQNQNIYQEDQLEILIQRNDEPPAQPPNGMPALDRVTLVEVQVTSDGYADFGKIGLGRIDVLGRQPAEVAALLSSELKSKFQIDAQIAVSIAAGGMPQAGRNRESVRLVYLDREPLKPGELVQIELPDGSWLHAVVEGGGTILAGRYGHVQAAGRSAAEVQESLYEIALRLAAADAEQNGQGPLTTAQAPKPMRVVNLSARRAAGVDSFAGTKVPCLIVLTTQGAEPPAAIDPPAPTNNESEKGASRPQPTTRPASSAPEVVTQQPMPPKRRPNQ